MVAQPGEPKNFLHAMLRLAASGDAFALPQAHVWVRIRKNRLCQNRNGTMNHAKNAEKFHIMTYGCQMNKLDSEILRGLLEERGFIAVNDKSLADIIIINTCSVRQHAEDKVYSLLGHLKRLKAKKPNLLVVVAGCMAQKEGEKLLERGAVDIVCGTRNFTRLPDFIRDFRSHPEPLVHTEMDAPIEFSRNPRCRPNKYSAFVAIMRGCNNFCSYCVVPYVRGREVSREKSEIIEEVKRLIDDGCREITLLGQNVNSYGKTLTPPSRLSELLADIDALTGVERLRFVTSHPKDFSSDLIDAIADLPSVCEHVHLPAQSGSDRILRAMNRGYTAEHYLRLIEEARSKVKDITFTSDFIVGFPNETEEDFMETVELMRRVRFLNSFIFKYSPRPRTAAARLPDNVPMEVKRERNQILLKEQQRISEEDNRRFIGKTVEVLVEGRSKRNPAKLSGRTRGNHIVVFEGDESLVGKLVRVRIDAATALTLYGTCEITTPSPAGKPQR